MTESEIQKIYCDCISDIFSSSSLALHSYDKNMLQEIAKVQMQVFCFHFISLTYRVGL
jgi:hypothetical protein